MPAPDYTAEIERLQKILDLGVTEHEIAGRVVKYDLEQIRKQRDEYRALAAAAAGERPARPTFLEVRFGNYEC
jgi:hypothetical protein